MEQLAETPIVGSLESILYPSRKMRQVGGIVRRVRVWEGWVGVRGRVRLY